MVISVKARQYHTEIHVMKYPSHCLLQVRMEGESSILTLGPWLVYKEV